MAITKQAKDAYDRYKKIKKAKGYYDSVKKLLDEDTRSGEVFRLGVKGLMKLGEKAIGRSLTSHPYFTFHKAHLEILAKAIDSSSMHDKAMEALNTAIKSADAAETLAKSLDSFTLRKNQWKLEYAFGIAGSMQVLGDLKSNPAQAAAQLKEAGHTADSLRTLTEDGLYAWRARVCELYFDSAELLAMVDVEYRATEAAMSIYNQKVKKLQESKNSLDFVAGKAAEKKRLEEWALRELQRANRPSRDTPSPQAVADPTGYAKLQRDKIDKVVQSLATICDVAMGDDAYDPAALVTKIGSL